MSTHTPADKHTARHPEQIDTKNVCMYVCMYASTHSVGRESPAPPSAGTYLPTLHTYIHTLLAVLRVCMLYVVYATHAALTRNLAGVSLSLSRSLGTCTFGYNMHRYLHIIHLGLWDRARGRGVHTLFSSQPANQPANQPTSEPPPPSPQAVGSPIRASASCPNSFPVHARGWRGGKGSLVCTYGMVSTHISYIGIFSFSFFLFPLLPFLPRTDGHALHTRALHGAPLVTSPPLLCTYIHTYIHTSHPISVCPCLTRSPSPPPPSSSHSFVSGKRTKRGGGVRRGIGRPKRQVGELHLCVSICIYASTYV